MNFVPLTVEQLKTPEGVAQLNEFLGMVLTNVPIIKKGTTQAAAGAAAGEIWCDSDDNTLKLGT